MSNPLLSLIDIDYPLIQAPMAGVSTPALAAAVSHAGALGSLGLGASTVTQAEAMIVATRQLTDRPFNVNLFCHAPPPARRPAGSRLGNNFTTPFCPLWQYATGFVKRDLPDIYRSCADAGAASRPVASGGEFSFWSS